MPRTVCDAKRVLETLLELPEEQRSEEIRKLGLSYGVKDCEADAYRLKQKEIAEGRVEEQELSDKRQTDMEFCALLLWIVIIGGFACGIVTACYLSKSHHLNTTLASELYG